MSTALEAPFYTDRTHAQSGAPGLKEPGAIRMVMNAEVRDVPNYIKCMLCCCPGCGCSCFDMDRSYIYVRENSVESNCAIKPCCGFCDSLDNIKVLYFDRPPFQTMICDNCGAGKPEVRVLDQGCMICCFECCSDKVAVVATPKMPCPCCCCPNASNKCCNCCNCCGPIEGNPWLYQCLYPQPKDAEKFAEALGSVLDPFESRDAPPAPDAVEMEDRS